MCAAVSALTCKEAQPKGVLAAMGTAGVAADIGGVDAPQAAIGGCK